MNADIYLNKRALVIGTVGDTVGTDGRQESTGSQMVRMLPNTTGVLVKETLFLSLYSLVVQMKMLLLLCYNITNIWKYNNKRKNEHILIPMS